MATRSKTLSKKPRVRRSPGPRFYELQHACPLRRIDNEAELDRAVAALDSLIDIGPKRRTRDEEDYMEALAVFVHAYEEATYPDPPADPAAMLRDIIEERGLKKQDLAAAAGIGLSTLSEIAAGKRPMTLNHIERLAKALDVKPSVFVD